MTARRIAFLKDSIDPIYPDLLVHGAIGDTSARKWHSELWMRSGLDGPGRYTGLINGEGYHTDFTIYRVDHDGFSGLIERYPSLDSAYFCAVRVRRFR